MSFPITLSERFASILDGLCRATAAHVAVDRSAGALILIVWTRLRRMRARFLRLIERFEAGMLPPQRARRPAPQRAEPRPAAAQDRIVIPRGFAWLAALVAGSASYGSQLQHLLTDLEMVALLKAAPQGGRILRPILWMTAIRPLPEAVRLPPRPRPSKLARAKARRRAAKARSLRLKRIPLAQPLTAPYADRWSQQATATERRSVRPTGPPRHRP